MAATVPEHRYGPTSGTVTGWLGLLICLGFAVDVVVDSVDGLTLVHVRWLLALGAAAVLLWMLMLRPVIVVRPLEVVLRNPFSSWLVPSAVIERVAVRALTRVGVGEETYDGVAVGRRMRSMLTGRSPRTSRRTDASTPDSLADLMTEQILANASDARRRGIGDGEVRRVWAVPELVALAALLVALVVTLVV